jgi:quercetin dioxygenase-like cupin family protein
MTAMAQTSRPRALLLAALAFVAGAAVGVGAAGAVRAGGDDRPSFDTRGRLDVLPAGPVNVRAETVHLGQGFRGRHEHGGPTFNYVVSGRARIIEDDGSATTYGPGGFFFEGADHPHTIEVLADLRLDVLHLVPPGAAETTDLPPR